MDSLLRIKPKNSNDNEYIILNDFEDENSRNGPEIIDFINNKSKSPATQANVEDIKLLARLIESEAGGESYEGKLAVGSVVINRSKEDKKTIRDVIYFPGQFEGISSINFNIEPSSESINAANEVVGGKDIIPDAYYYANLQICEARHIRPSFAVESKFIERIGNHWFFKK
ncbi:cell wall hydrolase [Clostridium sp. 19966]|uniref:cell wall hydrolase n=1 Tax=Clostridium sp. 19966 TaxID=2768166 RepID=UPI0028E0072C|nr:cell wall hydrolase [Clostridium sp. 19966]MDT8718231.1 cell wall hydrolase [Clostridium sp. 19966]